ncbi:MAG: DUF3037 domain-containing protein [Chitinophagales bacterium]
MKKYQYQLIRYVHDHFTGEFVNVGVILYSKENQFLACKTIRKYHRITQMFPEANGRWVIRLLNYLEQKINADKAKLQELFSLPDQIESITNGVLNNDNNAIRMSECKLGLDIDLDAALSGLFSQVVEKYYLGNEDKTRLSDDEVWKKKYKQYFEKYGIESKLSTHEVSVPNDILSFDKSWKNEIWHSYEPLSFELKKKDSIKEKVYKWAGKIQALKQLNEPLHISFLTSINPRHKELMGFIHEYLKSTDSNLGVEVVTEDQAENFAIEIKKQMERHDQGD